MLPTRVTLGGRLCTTEEVRTNDQTNITEAKKELQTRLSATVKGAGTKIGSVVSKHNRSERNQNHVKTGEMSRMVLQTQGGDGLLASR